MVRKIQKTFDWEVLVRFMAAATVAYVLTSALLHRHPGAGQVRAAASLLAAG